MTDMGPFGIESSEPYWPIFTDYEVVDGILKPKTDAKIKEFYSPLKWTELTPQHLKIFAIDRTLINDQSFIPLSMAFGELMDTYTDPEILIPQDTMDNLFKIIDNPQFGLYEEVMITWARQFGLPYVNKIYEQRGPLHGDRFDFLRYPRGEIATIHITNGIYLIDLLYEQKFIRHFVVILGLLKDYWNTSISEEEAERIITNLQYELKTIYGEDCLTGEIQNLFFLPRKPKDLKDVTLMASEKFLNSMIEQHSHSYRVNFGFSEGQMQIKWDMVTPLDAFYFHLLTSRGIPIKCSNSLCDNYFIPRRDDQKYCSEECQRRTKNRATKARSVLKNKVRTYLNKGKSIEEIATLANSSIELIEKLIK